LDRSLSMRPQYATKPLDGNGRRILKIREAPTAVLETRMTALLQTPAPLAND
jgi:hypothetical protein